MPHIAFRSTIYIEVLAATRPEGFPDPPLRSKGVFLKSDTSHQNDIPPAIRSRQGLHWRTDRASPFPPPRSPGQPYDPEVRSIVWTYASRLNSGTPFLWRTSWRARLNMTDEVTTSRYPPVFLQWRTSRRRMGNVLRSRLKHSEAAVSTGIPDPTLRPVNPPNRIGNDFLKDHPDSHQNKKGVFLFKKTPFALD